MKKEPFDPEERFGVSFSTLKRILDLALLKGGEFSEVFLEYRIYNLINMEEDIIKETAESISIGLGLRVVSGEKTGFGYTNNFEVENLERVARTASSIAQGTREKASLPFHPSLPPKNFYPLKTLLNQEPLKKKISLVKRAYQSALRFDKKVKKVKTTYTELLQYITILNSEGLLISDLRPLLKLTCVSIAESDKTREAGYYGGGGRVGLEYFLTSLTPEEIGEEASREALLLLEASPPPAGEMPVVLAAGESGVLIHEAVGHLLEADFNRKKTSIFWNKMGKKVASSQVTIFDDPTIPFFRGSYNMDDEGTIPQKTILVERGKMMGFLQDKLSSRLMGMPPTGHGRRQDYSSIPLPRMSNTYIAEGEFSPDEIISSVRKGFYAAKYQGGQVEDSGKFTFSVSAGYLIEEGRLTAPVKQATLIGSNIDILNKIEMVGSDLKFGLQTGTCSKEGQEIPVTDGCPTLKISSMTVGGRE